MDGGVRALRELVRYCAAETQRWREWLDGQDPAVLAVEAGEPPIATVGALLAHIVGVELIYGYALAGLVVPAYEKWWPPSDSTERIFAVHEDAFARLDSYLAGADDAALEREHVLRVPGWRLSASGGKMVAHMLVHGTRHWAQLATALRRSGQPQLWQHDLIAGEGFGPPGSFVKEE
jgi:uncharacterized damage-inducible protein DinB